MKLSLLCVVWVFTTTFLVVAIADESADRARAALPALVEQRNNAMDAAALCQGDVSILRAQLADAQKQLADAKAEIEKAKPAK